MGKISSTSKLNKSRVHNNYVEQNRRVTGANAINKVNPVDGIVNNANYSSGNYLFASDAFYDKLEKLSKEYRRFYHSERDLEHAIEDIDRNTDKLLEYMNNLIKKYNIAISALQNLEEDLGTNNTSIIENILLSYEIELNYVGVSIVNEKELEISNEDFIKSVINTQDVLSTLFRPIRGMITKLYKTFRNVRIPNNVIMENQYNQKNANEIQQEDYSGILMDIKS